MALPSQIEQWRSLVNTQLLKVVLDDPSLNASYGLTNDAIADYVLGIIDQESNGNPFVLGDHNPGTPSLPQNQMTSVQNVSSFLDYYDSIGLGQLNYGAGTPQGLGYKGDKAGLLDPTTNIYYIIRNFLKLLAKYNGNTGAALSAYNAGHSITSNVATYVEPILNSIKTVLSEKKISFSLEQPLSLS